MIGMIAATDRHGLLGYDGRIPWKNSTDLKRFKELTSGSTVIMGRKTFDSIGKPLPNRTNLVVSSDFQRFKDLLGFGPQTLDEAVSIASDLNKPIWIIGGAQIYSQGFAFADFLDLTEIDISCEIKDLNLTTYFPPIPNNFKLVKEEQNSNDALLVHRFYENN